MNRFSLITPITFSSVLLVLSFLLPASLHTQTPGGVATWLESYRLGSDFKPVDLLHTDNDRAETPAVVEYATMLDLDQPQLENLVLTPQPSISLTVPNAHGDNFELELVKVDLLTPDFTLGTLGDNAQDNLPYPGGVHYRGIVRGHPESVVALSVFKDGLMAMIADENGNYQIGKMEDGTNRYILYRSTDLKAVNPFNCLTDDHLTGPDAGSQDAGDRGIGCKTVGIYFECDYKLYQDKGSSVSNVTNYLTGLFNQISALYANENVGVAISQIYVWSSPDPYASMNSTSSVLNAFQSTRGTNFTGNLAHFVSTRSLGGGVAYVDVICTKSYAFGVSAINTSYSNVPTYSWSVEVMTHELGHNLGAWHTHSCNWTGGALDNCYSPEGSCSPGPQPTNGGTIMSYCHLSGTGINLNNGFGTQPGNKIRDRVQAASCLTSSGTVPSGLATSNLTGTSVTLSWGVVSGTTQYMIQYKLNSSSTWITAGTSVSPTYNLSGLTNNATYNWQVKTDCSGYSAAANFTTTTGSGGGGGGGCNAPLSLNTAGVTSSSAVLTWASVTGAALYTVQYKLASASSWVTAGTTYAVSFNLAGLSAGQAYNWQVKADCSAYSATASFTTTGSGGGGGGTTCSTPVNLGNSNIQATTARISWTAVPGATSYTVQLRLASGSTYFTLGTINSSSGTISGLNPATSYYWRVKANCSNYSAAKGLTTAVNSGSFVTTISSLPEVTLTEEHLYLYPNPANIQLFLDFGQPILPGAEIWITSATGQMALRQ
ncbi:MAG: M12 family metallo-peptidase, partial [Saprospiraceae bacterium]